PNVALIFLEKTKEKVKSSDEAVILCKTAIGALKLNVGDLPVTKVKHDIKSLVFISLYGEQLRMLQGQITIELQLGILRMECEMI
ncbi:hypothetical protein scyTo_0023148, partial [Scyliorhinus torazame]|nr:hypothetical protein [Scyliorhinus torazame]